MSTVERIIINSHDDMTSSERDFMLLSEMERTFNTGPIIGEARELIIHLSRNLQIRDLMLNSMGVKEKDKEKLFVTANEFIKKLDDEILDKRKKKLYTKT